MKKLTTEQFIEKAREVHGNKYDYSKVEYVNNNTKVCIICPKHGEFWQTPDNHMHGQKCYKCSKISMGNKQRISEEEVKKRIIEKYGDRFDLSKLNFTDYKHKVTLICKEHGEFSITLSNLFKKTSEGCRRCGIEKRTKLRALKLDDFKKRALELHNGKYVYSKVEYKNNRTKVCIICPIHGEFWQTPDNHLNKIRPQGCPKCKSSNLERSIIKFLTDKNIKHIHQCGKKEFDWLKKQRLDFYLPEHKIAIECQGEQHFIGSNFGSKRITDEESLNIIKNRDIKKKKLCEEHGIKLLYFSNKQYEDNVITDENKLLEEIKKT